MPEDAGHPKPVPVGEDVTVRLHLDQIACRGPPGHRLRLSISNAYWPLIWPAPGRAMLRPTSGPLTLETAKDAGAVRVAEPDMAPPWQTCEMRPANHLGETEVDRLTGVARLRIVDDFGQLRDPATGLETG